MTSSRSTPRPRPWPAVQRALRPLDADEFATLKRSIQRFRVAEAIKVLPDGRIIDGHHRFEIAGDAAPVRVISLPPQEAFQLAMQLNLARRHLNAAERRAAAKSMLKANPVVPYRDVASACHVGRKVVAEVAAEVAADISPTGPISTTPTPKRKAPRARTREEVELAHMLHEEGMHVAEIGRRLSRPPSTVGKWLREPRPIAEDELAYVRVQRRRRNDAAWARLIDINAGVATLWNEDRGALLKAIHDHPEHNLVVALAHATRRTREIADAILAEIDPMLADDERQRIDAFMRSSGFGA